MVFYLLRIGLTNGLGLSIGWFSKIINRQELGKGPTTVIFKILIAFEIDNSSQKRNR
jgi:hypothetical protein